jgi:transposase
MLDLQDFLTLKNLHEQDLSYSEISRQTGFSRKTVRKYILSDAPPEAKKRTPKSSKLDDYKDYIIQRLKSYPVTASKIYNEIQDRGFVGKYTIVRDFVRENRPR